MEHRKEDEILGVVLRNMVDVACERTGDGGEENECGGGSSGGQTREWEMMKQGLVRSTARREWQLADMARASV